MATKKKEKTPLSKKGWTQSFNLIGEAKISDFTFEFNKTSEKSDWIWNEMNLQINCGEKYGNVDCKLSGGYGKDRDNVCWVHGKKNSGKIDKKGNPIMVDDFENMYTIDWDDRQDEDILADVGDLCFLTVGLEKDTDDKTFYNKILAPYDAIEYIKEHLENGMVVNVKGQLKYTVYNDTVNVKKEVNSIVLSSATPDKYRATFTQTMLLDKDSVGKPDKEKCVLPISGYILEKFKEYNGNDLTEGGKIKGGQFVPLMKTFEFEFDKSEPEKTKKAIDKVFKVKKGVTKLTVDGVFCESGSVVTITVDDIPQDIKDLIELGYYTEEEALTKCAGNGSKEKRMILVKPQIKLVGDDDNKTPVIQKFEEEYTEDDLMLDYLIKREDDDEDEEVEEIVEETVDEATSDDDNEDWLAML